MISNGVLGGTLPLAAGLAYTEKLNSTGNIVVVFIGDGTLGEGVLYETLNIVSKWSLPLFIVVENNRYAQSTKIDLTLAGNIPDRFKAFGIETSLIETFDVLKIMNESKKIPGAGVVVVKSVNDEWKVCCLKIENTFDLPKGHIDPGESAHQAAVRETWEETGISDLNFSWGNISLQLAHLTMYVAFTNQEGYISANPHSGIFEHEEIHWLGWDEAMACVKPYLSPAIMWARNRVEGAQLI